MAQELIFSGVVAQGAQRQYTLSRGHVNGLLIRTAYDAGSTLTIKRRVDSKVLTLCSQFRLLDLRRIASLEYGLDYRSDVASVIRQALVTKALMTAAEFNTAFTNAGLGSPDAHPFIYVPLGSMYLGSDSEIDITFTADSSASWGAGQDVRFYAFDNERVPDFSFQYDTVQNLEQQHQAVESLWLSHANNTNFIASITAAGGSYDLGVDYDDGDGMRNTDIHGLMAESNVFYNVESRQVSDVAAIYRNRDAIPRNVFLRVKGANTADARVIARRKVYTEATSRNTIKELDELAKRTAQLEATNSDLALQLRHAGELQKATDLALAAMQAKGSAAADAAKAGA